MKFSKFSILKKFCIGKTDWVSMVSYFFYFKMVPILSILGSFPVCRNGKI